MKPFASAADDALFEATDGRVFQVHLTLSRRLEQPPLPRPASGRTERERARWVLRPANEEYCTLSIMISLNRTAEVKFPVSRLSSTTRVGFTSGWPTIECNLQSDGWRPSMLCRLTAVRSTRPRRHVLQSVADLAAMLSYRHGNRDSRRPWNRTNKPVAEGSQPPKLADFPFGAAAVIRIGEQCPCWCERRASGMLRPDHYWRNRLTPGSAAATCGQRASRASSGVPEDQHGRSRYLRNRLLSLRRAVA